MISDSAYIGPPDLLLSPYKTERQWAIGKVKLQPNAI